MILYKWLQDEVVISYSNLIKAKDQSIFNYTFYFKKIKAAITRTMLQYTIYISIINNNKNLCNTFTQCMCIRTMNYKWSLWHLYKTCTCFRHIGHEPCRVSHLSTQVWWNVCLQWGKHRAISPTSISCHEKYSHLVNWDKYDSTILVFRGILTCKQIVQQLFWVSLVSCEILWHGKRFNESTDNPVFVTSPYKSSTSTGRKSEMVSCKHVQYIWWSVLNHLLYFLFGSIND